MKRKSAFDLRPRPGAKPRPRPRLRPRQPPPEVQDTVAIPGFVAPLPEGHLPKEAYVSLRFSGPIEHHEIIRPGQPPCWSDYRWQLNQPGVVAEIVNFKGEVVGKIGYTPSQRETEQARIEVADRALPTKTVTPSTRPERKPGGKKGGRFGRELIDQGFALAQREGGVTRNELAKLSSEFPAAWWSSYLNRLAKAAGKTYNRVGNGKDACFVVT